MFFNLSLIIGLPLILGGGATLLFGRKRYKQTIPGLLFHSVHPKPAWEMSHYALDRFKKICTHLKNSNYRPITLYETRSLIDSQTNDKNCFITFDDGLQSVYDYALPVLERYSFKSTIFCTSGFYGKRSTWDIFSYNRHLSKEQIRLLSDKGHEIGSHTCTHPYLPFLDNKAIERELSDSKKELENITGKTVQSCSFPYGGWNETIWKIARDVGYSAATLYRNHDKATEDLYPVYGVYRYESVADVIEKLALEKRLSLSRARSNMMAHFAKGTPVWKFRKDYLTG